MKPSQTHTSTKENWFEMRLILSCIATDSQMVPTWASVKRKASTISKKFSNRLKKLIYDELYIHSWLKLSKSFILAVSKLNRKAYSSLQLFKIDLFEWFPILGNSGRGFLVLFAATGAEENNLRFLKIVSSTYGWLPATRNRGVETVCNWNSLKNQTICYNISSKTTRLNSIFHFSVESFVNRRFFLSECVFICYEQNSRMKFVSIFKLVNVIIIDNNDCFTKVCVFETNEAENLHCRGCSRTYIYRFVFQSILVECTFKLKSYSWS